MTMSITVSKVDLHSTRFVRLHSTTTRGTYYRHIGQLKSGCAVVKDVNNESFDHLIYYHRPLRCTSFVVGKHTATDMDDITHGDYTSAKHKILVSQLSCHI